MMNTPIHFTDEQFNPHNSGTCHLLIHLNAHSYSYAIVDKETNRISELCENYLPENTVDFSASSGLEILMAEHENLNLKYSTVKISVETKAFTFIPEKLYSSNDVLQYSKFIGAEPNSALLQTDIRAYGIKNISAFEADLENNLQHTFPDSLILSQANPFIAGIYELKKQGIPGELFLNFSGIRFEAAVVRNETLEFYNIFDITSADEFNYFILSLIDRLNIDRSLQVNLSGNIDSENELYHRLQKYFTALRFTEIGLWNNEAEFSDQVAPHRFFSLLALDLCE